VMRAEWRFGRFGLVGLMGAMLQSLLIWGFTKHLGIVGGAATPLAVEITILHNFLWHERFTWSGCCPKGFRERAFRLWRFHAGNGLISLGGNTILMYSLVDRFHAPAMPVAIGGIVLCSLANFFVANRWVYASAFERP
jgi:putative flippase GtrA